MPPPQNQRRATRDIRTLFSRRTTTNIPQTQDRRRIDHLQACLSGPCTIPACQGVRISFNSKSRGGPNLRHANYCTRDAAAPRQNARHSEGELARAVPIIKIVPAKMSPRTPENEVLLRDDDDEECGPVAEDAKEVGEDLREMFTPCNACDRIDDACERNPKETRDEREGAAQRLHGETRRVGVWDIIRASGGVSEAIDEDKGRELTLLKMIEQQGRICLHPSMATTLG